MDTSGELIPGYTESIVRSIQFLLIEDFAELISHDQMSFLNGRR